MSQEPGIPPVGLPIEDELPQRVGVLVLGGGLAGAAALLAAAEAGQYALLLEKLDSFGGSTVRSAGACATGHVKRTHKRRMLEKLSASVPPKLPRK